MGVSRVRASDNPDTGRRYPGGPTDGWEDVGTRPRLGDQHASFSCPIPSRHSRDRHEAPDMPPAAPGLDAVPDEAAEPCPGNFWAASTDPSTTGPRPGKTSRRLRSPSPLGPVRPLGNVRAAPGGTDHRRRLRPGKHPSAHQLYRAPPWKRPSGPGGRCSAHGFRLG